jgi:hypothetical protein
LSELLAGCSTIADGVRVLDAMIRIALSQAAQVSI